MSNFEKENDSESDVTLKMMDKFLQIYNKKHQTSGSIFENVNIKDPSATNDKMELFYEYMLEHQSLQAENDELTDVYEPDMKIENSDSYEVYALVMGKNSKTKYISLSFISLLKVGVQSSDLGADWSIIKL
jgi:hypothetical protein